MTRFLGGLKDEIRSPIALHRPPNLETAYSLALIQEEELAAQKSKHTKWEPKQGRYPVVPDKFKGNHKREEPKPGEPRVLEDKWGALKSYRKANGLCFTCGEKWQGKGHKCPDKISINVIQELLEMCQLSADPEEADVSDSEGDTEQPIFAVSTSPVLESVPRMAKRRKTMRFQGFVCKKEILILLDSGSAATFISDELASRLHCEQVACEKIKYSTAHGSPLESAVHVPNFQWYIQGHSFAYHTRVLSIKGFDMIFGADWLEDHSPMWIHWKKKLLKLPLNGKRIQLKGIRPVVTKCAKVSVHKLKGLIKNHAITHCVHLQAVSPAADHDSLIFPVTHSTEITTPSSVPLPDSVPPVVQELVQQY